MTPQYSINLNYKVLNETFAGGQEEVVKLTSQLIEKITQSSCEVKLENTEEGMKYNLSVKDSYVAQIVDRSLKTHSVKDTILTKISKLISNDENELRESLIGKVEDFVAKEIETRLLALEGIPGLIMMKNDQPLVLENNSMTKLKM